MVGRPFARVAHLQIADTPGRHEPGTGEIHYPLLFLRLDRLGCARCICCEHNPAATTAAGLRLAARSAGDERAKPSRASETWSAFVFADRRARPVRARRDAQPGDSG
jgi:hypothetical protein